MYRIGVVGTGIIAETHKNAILKNKESELVCVCDIDRDKAEKYAVGTEALIFTDYKEILENVEIDAVILNLPHFLHKEATVYFLEHNVNVLIEKPMANSAEECFEMKKAAEKSGKKLVVGHMQRYVPAHRELKKIIENETLGKLCVVTETRNIDYFSEARPKWFLDKKTAGGGIVMNYGAHTMDKLFYLLDSKVKSVSSNVSNILNDKTIEAQAQALIEFENGVSASLSYCAARISYIYETYFFFTDGVVKIEDGSRLLVHIKDKPFEEVKLDTSIVPIEEQFNEFIKLLNGETADFSDADYGMEIISVIEQILN